MNWYTFNVYTETGTTIQISAKAPRYEEAEAAVIQEMMRAGHKVVGYAQVKAGMKL